MRSALTVAFFAGGLLAARAAFAQQDARVDDVEALLARADFEEAEASAGRALTSGTLTSAGAARVYLALGTIAAARAQPIEAERFFRDALVIDPQVSLPPSAGPHVVERFLAARRARDGKVPPTLTMSLRLDRDPSVAVADVDVQGDPEGLADRVLLRGHGVYDRRALRDSGIHFAETLPEDSLCVSLVADIVDQWGNELWPALARETICRPAPAPAASTEAVVRVETGSPRPSLPASVWVMTGSVTAGLAVATTTFGLLALDRHADFNRASSDPQSSAGQRSSLKSSAQTFDYATAIAGAATLGAAAVTITLLVTRAGPAPSRIGIGVAPSTSGVCAVLSGDL